MSIRDEAVAILQRLGVFAAAQVPGLSVGSAYHGRDRHDLTGDDDAVFDGAIGRAHAAFEAWRGVPPPRRGESVRLLGEELRAAKAVLDPDLRGCPLIGQTLRETLQR